MNKYQVTAEAIELMTQYARRLHLLGMRSDPELTRFEMETLLEHQEGDADYVIDKAWMQQMAPIGMSTYQLPDMTWQALMWFVPQLESLRIKWVAVALESQLDTRKPKEETYHLAA